MKSGWDCFGVSGPRSENITIRRVLVHLTHGSNAAGITVGSEMSGGVADVFIEDCTVLAAGAGVEVKVGAERGGFVANVVVRGLRVYETRRGALVVMAVYPERNPFCQEGSGSPQVGRIEFERVMIHGPTRGAVVDLRGSGAVECERLRRCGT